MSLLVASFFLLVYNVYVILETTNNVLVGGQVLCLTLLRWRLRRSPSLPHWDRSRSFPMSILRRA
jgi:hypothetical protein